MARNFNELRAVLMEKLARENYFLQTGNDFSDLSPVEQRKLVEVELERSKERSYRESEGGFSLIPGPGRNNGGFDFQE